MEVIKNELDINGYCIIDNVLDESEIDQSKEMFYNWQKTIFNHDKIHNTVNPHGIYKYHEIGHQRHAWFIRTNPKVQNIFKKLWNTDDLIVSFDGSCFISKDNNKKDKIWTHTDQGPNNNNKCYQAFVSLTNNEERTLVVYKGSHLYHQKYFQDKNIKSKSNWHLIDHTVLENLKDSKKVLKVKAGSLVIWDSRCFHQNQYGKPFSEERIVQYVCYFPKNNKYNTPAMIKKRQKYFDDRRTTSHWPAPIKVNGKQPRTFGDESKIIDYSRLIKPDLDDMILDIKKII